MCVCRNNQSINQSFIHLINQLLM